jgi:glutaconyl-CoA decarboxylase
MKSYFEHMDAFGKELKAGRIKRAAESKGQLEEAEASIATEKKKVEEAGFPTEKINARGWMTVWQRIEYLVDEGSWTPLHSLYNPLDNAEGTTNVVDGLAKIEGRWAVVIGFDNKVMAGAWLPGQSENILRVTDLAHRLNVPLAPARLSSVTPSSPRPAFPCSRGSMGRIPRVADTRVSARRSCWRTRMPTWLSAASA